MRFISQANGPCRLTRSLSIAIRSSRTLAKVLGPGPIFACAVLVAGCGKNNEPPPPATIPVMSKTSLPPNHPVLDKAFSHPASGSQPNIIPSPEAAAKWKSADLSVRAAGHAEQRLRVSIGGQQPVTATDLTISVLAYLPSFKINGNTVTSSSNNPDNPAVFVQLRNPQGKLAEGWVFQKLPQFDTFHSDKVTVTLLLASPLAR